MLTHSFETLAQSFRIMIESDWNYKRLLNVDRAEAIGNLESGLSTQLNAFHSFYDQMLALQFPPDWYLTPELLSILVIRNARHHNKANRIRTLPTYHRYEISPPEREKTYFYVDTPETEDGGDFFNVPISWADIDEMLSLPKNESKLKPEARERVREYLNADLFEKAAQERGFTKGDIFINYVGLSHNAGVALYPYIKDNIVPDDDSVEAKYFIKHFETVESADTRNPVFSLTRFKLP
ncbi:TPA: hypothetical protein N5N91_004553 [Enterobacter roggenkampii]|nr:hypothetical protein [Enterobacter roggenkampii]